MCETMEGSFHQRNCIFAIVVVCEVLFDVVWSLQIVPLVLLIKRFNGVRIRTTCLFERSATAAKASEEFGFKTRAVADIHMSYT